MAAVKFASAFFILAAAVSLGVGDDCEPTWQTNRDNHVPTDLTSDAASLFYLAEFLRDDPGFEAHLDAILLERPVNTENHAIVEEYITETLSDLGWTVTSEEFVDDTPVGPVNFANLVAHLDPDAPRRLVLACHYESVPTIEGFVGATDAAVPCAMLLHLATAMTDIMREAGAANPELTVTMLFFDGEEAMQSFNDVDGLYGSKRISADWDAADYDVGDGTGFCQTEQADFIDRMDLLFLLDLLGVPDPDFQTFLFDTDLDSNPYYDMMAEIEEALDELLPVATDSMFNGIVGSPTVTDDHSPFLDVGLERIFYVLTRPFPDVWHTLDDNRDCLDFDYIARMNQLLRVWTAQYLQYPGIPVEVPVNGA